MENRIAKLEHVLYRAKIMKDIRSKVELKLIECLADDEEVCSNLGNTFNDELLEQMKARYGPYKTITEENVDEFLDQQFMRTEFEMKDDKGKAKVTADLLDELFISRTKETLQDVIEGTRNQKKEDDDKQRKARPDEDTSEQRKARSLNVTGCVFGLRAKLKELALKRGSKCCSLHSKKKN
ncbi:hypothetical protein CTI12_AA309020 [Artemisia annua]|uniref:Uncharacterized protein n=1 Tax=Artemisia annua TaxID=35608 RepID=A0A2U1N3G7_ARTAN|nr:hypothetical protein CTI12_AA309020 [Artemisia annua]